MPTRPKTDRQRARAKQPPPKEHRGSAASRGYGRRHQRMRAWYMNQVNWRCEQCGEYSTHHKGSDMHLDHIVPIAQGGDNSVGNLQALCKGCHSQKTAREDGGFGR